MKRKPDSPVKQPGVSRHAFFPSPLEGEGKPSCGEGKTHSSATPLNRCRGAPSCPFLLLPNEREGVERRWALPFSARLARRARPSTTGARQPALHRGDCFIPGPFFRNRTGAHHTLIPADFGPAVRPVRTATLSRWQPACTGRRPPRNASRRYVRNTGPGHRPRSAFKTPHESVPQ